MPTRTNAPGTEPPALKSPPAVARSLRRSEASPEPRQRSRLCSCPHGHAWTRGQGLGSPGGPAAPPHHSTAPSTEVRALPPGEGAVGASWEWGTPRSGGWLLSLIPSGGCGAAPAPAAPAAPDPPASAPSPLGEQGSDLHPLLGRESLCWVYPPKQGPSLVLYP